MATELEVTAVLCDAASTADGKLNLLGGGWSRLVADFPAPVALAIIVHIPFDMTNRQLKLETDLLDDDGDPVEIEGQIVKGYGEFEVGRPPGIKQGEEMPFPMVLNFNGLALPAGGYVFVTKVQDQAVARNPFRVI